MKSVTRRHFLRQTGAFSLLGTAAPMALNLAGISNAVAAGASDYKALICIHMAGGNDAYNTVLATDDPSWSAYTYERCTDDDGTGLRPVGTAPVQDARAPFADQLGGALSISPKNPNGRKFAVHPVLGGVRSLFASGRLAVVANVGPLIQPTTKVQYEGKTVPLPAHLFSHNDQSCTWQSGAIEGATSGWGGRMVERFLADNGSSMFTGISMAGAAAWANGEQLVPYQMALGGAIAIGEGEGNALYNSFTAQQRLLDVVSNARNTQWMSRDHADVVVRSNNAVNYLKNAGMPPFGQAPWGTPGALTQETDPLMLYVDPDGGVVTVNPLAQQLQTVARMISIREALGVKRQVFFVTLDGCDTHSGQGRRHASLMARLNHALTYLDATLNAMGVSQSVTTFTSSDFGRSFTNNGDGTDHGWGGHHLVMGGAVKGGDIYGAFPQYSASDADGKFSSDNQLADGVLLPNYSVDQYGATLAQWFGLSVTEAKDVFPNLGNFQSLNLGFI